MKEPAGNSANGHAEIEEVAVATIHTGPDVFYPPNRATVVAAPAAGEERTSDGTRVELPPRELDKRREASGQASAEYPQAGVGLPRERKVRRSMRR